MKRAFSLFLGLGLLSQAVFADDGVAIGNYRAPITRNGKAEVKLIYNFWSGEYPGPVFDVKAKMKGTTVIQAEKNLRVLGSKVKCTIKNALYHPWSQSVNSAENYLTISATSSYRALKNITLDNNESTQVSAGQELADAIYLSENFCSANLMSANGKRLKTVEFGCETLDDATSIQVVKNAFADRGHSNEQWISLKCAEGYRGFVNANSLLKQKGIKLGTITGYGEVGPSNSK